MLYISSELGKAAMLTKDHIVYEAGRSRLQSLNRSFDVVPFSIDAFQSKLSHFKESSPVKKQGLIASVEQLKAVANHTRDWSPNNLLSVNPVSRIHSYSESDLNLIRIADESTNDSPRDMDSQNWGRYQTSTSPLLDVSLGSLKSSTSPQRVNFKEIQMLSTNKPVDTKLPMLVTSKPSTHATDGT